MKLTLKSIVTASLLALTSLAYSNSDSEYVNDRTRDSGYGGWGGDRDIDLEPQHEREQSEQEERARDCAWGRD